MEEMKLDALVVLDTWWKGKGAFIALIPNSENSYQVNFSRVEKSRKGAALVMKQKIAKTINSQ